MSRVRRAEGVWCLGSRGCDRDRVSFGKSCSACGNSCHEHRSISGTLTPVLGVRFC